MASNTLGIAALFSMYNDDEEEEDADEPRPPSAAPPAAATSSSTSPRTGGESSNPNPNPDPSPERPSLPLSEGQADRKTLASPQLLPRLPPLPPRRSSPSVAVSSASPPRPPLAAPPADLPRPPRGGALAIVDYAHDEMAMSPDQEDGEIMSGVGGFGSDALEVEGNLEERLLSRTVHILTPNTISERSQHSDAPEQNQVGTDVAMDATGTETVDARVEEASDISTNVQNDDPLSRFLPPPVATKCSASLQQKINKFLAYRRAGKSFNAEVRNRKDYRNPDFLQHAVRYQEIDQIGSCFSKDVFDPYGYDKSDYYDEIEADMKRELERKDQEKKRNPKVDFISSGVQPPVNSSITKIAAAISAAAGASVQASAESVQKETRPNKKSKWDKVDGDIKNPAAPSGHDNMSASGGSAAVLPSGNVVAGYAAFAQQKRREAEERRTSDYKSDKSDRRS
ncbi:SAP30-binding protein isoform X1 [Brachypodium distachyon]|uniref:Uncharacterized protein n=2 Tax=Brachypodium distachyon TaxID=15368 RepID=I1HRS8_BRADI|nr:SAP30-binding protein isoform X1 [Brachypodium distachyon]KQK09835.1 hypothetical protein BRADI_2g50450v3 [Brachypodium distachyon]PNT72889.1 hypothetical protein BRADI_2g50450v3 [Brachypodium distachyon]PNT72890.1 hypothetical protein BRADI_2g50450v3 [Brachypodium distachyon]PNT72891.1 hypothetical protein BRADI_2g50450v3 [Brachypodium distachyon]|eukprot:XP_014754586.1 SAP30-binding protein isoform X1 [Brachypodium distachyon]